MCHVWPLPTHPCLSGRPENNETALVSWGGLGDAAGGEGEGAEDRLGVLDAD